MTAKKINSNPLPVSFEQFKKNPVAAVAFCMLVAVSYLYYDVKTGYADQIKISNDKMNNLEIKIDKMNSALKKSDSALSAAITELRIINTMKKF